VGAVAGSSALARGFAVVSTDAGHQGRDASFGHDQQARLDYGYHALGRVTAAAKQIVAACGPELDQFYPYPQQAHYLGTGSTDNAASFACR